MRASLLPLLAACALMGCAGAPAPAPCAALGVSDSQRDNQRGAMTGSAKVPARLVGAPVTGAAGALAEVPLAAGTVHAGDFTGRSLPGLAAAAIAPDGSFRLTGVPGGYVFFVVATFTEAGGGPAQLMTIARSAPEGAIADLDTATTLVASALAASMEGFSAPFNPGRFRAAVSRVRTKLQDDPALDLSSPEAARRALDAMRDADPTLDAEIAGLEAAFGASR